MKLQVFVAGIGLLVAFGIAAPGGLARAQSTNTSVKQIDSQCNAIQDAIMALHPVHVALTNGTWKVLSASDYTIAERTRASITLIDAWRQGNNYAWIHSHSLDAAGNQRATQLCFRQSDGTLARAKQAKAVPDLSAASAQTAYYSSSGTVIQKTSLFEMNDPAIAKQIKALPYYSVLP